MSRTSSTRPGGAGGLLEELRGLEALPRGGAAERRDSWLRKVPPERVAAALERLTAAAAAEPGNLESRREVWDLLDVLRLPGFLRRIPRDEIEAWASRILAGVDASHFTAGPLFRHRAERYGSKVLFQVPGGGGTRSLTWRRVAARVDRYATALYALGPEPAPVAILSENRLEMALADLACLTSGLVNVMVPANSTETDVAYILRHSRTRTVIVSNQRQLAKVLVNRDTLPDLQHIVSMDVPAARHEKVLHLEQIALAASGIGPEGLRERGERVRIDELATVMYTSGTTGTPKGIMFSHRNLVFKRFARALALPEIGEDDVFLCFLPLCHTFGRFLEMMGCIFWGSTYSFLENPSVEVMIRSMRRYRPTVFISVPKKWIQLHESIVQRADPHEASDAELAQATREATGGRLAWGLSAAGHLDPDIFRFFQAQGTELMSGFGMTEATGGITMTPPGQYEEESLGPALPGIELELADDGELLVRGPYVMTGYLDPPQGDPGFDERGWFRTGDLMEIGANGHLRLVDRKKEIYKNIKGQTIAPQRVENLFRDLESVGRAFLVGDHREYNTVLIYPNPNHGELDFDSLPAEEVREHFRSLVVSVNKFLAPFERIVDFAIIERDLDAERDELTAKGSPRRKNVARNFADVIRRMYRRANLRVGGVEVILPNWLIQSLGLTAQDIRIDEECIALPASRTRLTVRCIGPGETQIGSCVYRHPPRPINLGALLTSPRLWLGNEELVDLLPLETADRHRPGRTREGIEWRSRDAPFKPSYEDHEALLASLRRPDQDLLDLDRAARMLAAADEQQTLDAVRLLHKIVAETKGSLVGFARLVLARAALSDHASVRRRGFLALVESEREERFEEILHTFLDRDPALLDGPTRSALCKINLPEGRIEAFVRLGQEACADNGNERAVALLQFLASFGTAHPTSYRRLRAFLVRMGLFGATETVRQRARDEVAVLCAGFRQWLGTNSAVAVDPETGQEYGWHNVIVFDDGVDEDDRERLLDAMQGTAFLREAAFLFFQVLIRLSDIPPGGVWVRHLGTRHGKSVYRITIQTRLQGHFDLAANLNHSLTTEQVEEEIHWLILGGDSRAREPLVEDFGGFWSEQGLWSEEFITGETLDRALRRLSKRSDEQARLQQLWVFLAWTALSAYVDFWHRSGKRWEIADPTMSNVVVPTDDYLTGVRIVSVAARRRHQGLLSMVRAFMDEFITPATEQYPVLEGIVGWPVLFSSVLEIVDEDEGLAMFREALEQAADDDDEMLVALREYIRTVEVRGFLPRRMFFAAKRYRRWERLSSSATPRARARTLLELYETYGLRHLARTYPETRLRFFRETVFQNSQPALSKGLDELIHKVRTAELVGDELIDAIADLRSHMELSADEDYFLARASLPYLKPEDAADFVLSRLGGRPKSEIVVALEDQEGNSFRVRHALNPKEVERLHRLFVAAKLDVRFRPEHRHLVAINERIQIIGGIYYEIGEDNRSAHLEKIVVAERFRRKGVADGLMNDFFNRLRSAGVKTVTTGFFRPEYFYRFGFRIEKQYAGLVKSLEEEPETDPT